MAKRNNYYHRVFFFRHLARFLQTIGVCVVIYLIWAGSTNTAVNLIVLIFAGEFLCERLSSFLTLIYEKVFLSADEKESLDKIYKALEPGLVPFAIKAISMSCWFLYSVSMVWLICSALFI